MLLDDVRVGDVVELNTPTAGQTFHVFVYEIAEDEVRYRYGLMGASVGQCLMSCVDSVCWCNIVKDSRYISVPVTMCTGL